VAFVKVVVLRQSVFDRRESYLSQVLTNPLPSDGAKENSEKKQAFRHHDHTARLWMSTFIAVVYQNIFRFSIYLMGGKPNFYGFAATPANVEYLQEV
jgi:hypothetical protein